MKDDERPPLDSPEFKEWLKKKTARDMEDIFGENYKPAEFETGGATFGDADSLYKTDAELFPDELEEYTPEERRKILKVHKGGLNKDAEE